MCVACVPCELFSVFLKCTSAWCCEELAPLVTDVCSSVQAVGARTLPCTGHMPLACGLYHLASASICFSHPC